MLNIKSEYVSQESLIAEFFDATFTLQDYQFREDGLFVKLFIDAEVQYPNYDDRSYFGNAVDLLFVKKNNQIKIADIFFYGDTDSSDIVLSADKWSSQNVRFENSALAQVEQDILVSKQIMENYDSTILEFEKEAGAEILKEQKDQQQSAESVMAASYTEKDFNRTAMVNYAKRTAPLKSGTDCKLYYNGTSARGSSQVPYYYDFSRISGAYDCTNFASHVLLAGGARVTSNWFFNNMNTTGPGNRSASWSSVNAFRNAFMNNRGAGPRVAVNGPEEGTILYAEKGDMVQWKYSDYAIGGYGHTTVITDTSTWGNPGLTSRSSNSSYKVNQQFTRKLNNLDGGNHVIGYLVLIFLNYAY